MKNILKPIVAVAVISAAPVLAGDQGLVILDWGGYDDPGFFGDFVEKYGDVPSYSFFSDEEEAYQKLRSGFQADLAHPCAQSIAKWRLAGVIEPLDISRIERWDEVNEIKEDFKYEDGYFFLPIDWGATALLYRTDMVDAAKTNSLDIFVDPEYAGRTSLPDNVDDVYALGLLAVGVTDWTVATKEDVAKASEWLRRAHQNVRTYWADGGELAQLMTSGEVAVAWSWNETPTALIAEGVPVAYNRETVEGSTSWFCGYVNSANGANDEDKLYDFLNAWLEPESASYIVNEWGYGHSNQVAMTALGTELLNEVGLGPVGVPVLPQAPMSHELREIVITEFEMIKAGF